MKQKKDSLEGFFGKQLQKQSFEFDEAQWQKLAQRLDQQKDRGFVFWLTAIKRKWLIGALLVVLISAIAFWLGWHLRGLQLVARVNNATLPLSQLEIMQLGHLGIQDSLHTSGFLDLIAQAKTTEGSAHHKNQGSNVFKTDYKSGGKHGNEADAVTAHHKAVDSIERQVENDFLRQNPVKDSASTAFRENKPPVEVKRKQVAFLADGRLLIPMIDFLYQPLVADSLREIRKAPWSKVAIGAFVAPDFNSTNIAGLTSEFSGALGLDYSYQLSTKFRLLSGFSLNNKRYNALAEAYKPKPGFWVNGIVPENINAQCLVLNVPIEIGFKFNKSTTKAWWVNLGVSNYWMLSEVYQYQYPFNYPNAVNGWEGKTKKAYLLSSVDISISYCTSIGKNIQLVASPYFKYHLKGIGHGSVELLSSGINLGIRYQRTRNSKSNTLNEQ